MYPQIPQIVICKMLGRQIVSCVYNYSDLVFLSDVLLVLGKGGCTGHRNASTLVDNSQMMFQAPIIYLSLSPTFLSIGHCHLSRPLKTTESFFIPIFKFSSPRLRILLISWSSDHLVEKQFDFFLSYNPMGLLKNLTDLNIWTSFFLPPGACKIKTGDPVFKNVKSLFAWVSVCTRL